MPFPEINEPFLRLFAFAAALCLTAIWEARRPFRAASRPRTERWIVNLGMGALNVLLLRLLFPILAAGTAIYAEKHGIGLFNRLALPTPLAFLFALLALDVLIYAQHRLMHAWPLLWRLHAVHHADPEVDASTALRFHPFEIILSMGLKIAAVLLLGAPPEAVVTFEILLNAAAIFNHANARLPAPVERILRLIIITPDMHRIHHSQITQEMTHNFGFTLSIWDRLFASCLIRPQGGQEKIKTGLSGAKGAPTENFLWLLRLPFRNAPL